MSINWIEALKHHATDSGRVELTAQRIEDAATSMRENSDERNWDEITKAERKLQSQIDARGQTCDQFGNVV